MSASRSRVRPHRRPSRQAMRLDVFEKRPELRDLPTFAAAVLNAIKESA